MEANPLIRCNKIAEAQKGTYVLNFGGRWPVFDACNFDRVHVSHHFFKNYPQVIDTRCMEDTLLKFEVQVMFGGEGEYITNCGHMAMNRCVVHVDVNGSAKEFMFVNEGTKDVNHHGLEGGGGIGESKEHYCWFKETIMCFKGSLVLIAFLYTHIIISPVNVQFGVYVCTTKVGKKVRDEGKRILVANGMTIDAVVVLDRA